MGHIGYTQAAFDQRQAQMAEAKAKELSEDLDFQAATRKLEKTQAARDDLEAHVSRIVNVKQRLAWNAEREAAKLAVHDAERAVSGAKNAFYSRARMLVAEEKDAKREKEQTKEQQRHAKQEEQEAKTQFREAFLVAGGTAEKFEAAWPDMWQKEVQQRAQEQLHAAKQHMARVHGYSL